MLMHESSDPNFAERLKRLVVVNSSLGVDSVSQHLRLSDSFDKLKNRFSNHRQNKFHCVKMEQNKLIIRTKVNECFRAVMGRYNYVPLQVSKLSTTSSLIFNLICFRYSHIRLKTSLSFVPVATRKD